MYRQHKFGFKTRKEDPSLVNAFQKRNFKLLVDPVEQGISCLRRRERTQESVRDKELACRKNEEPSYNHPYISVNITNRR